MGRQVNFFLHKDDQLEFDLLLKSFGEVILVPYYQYQSEVSTVEDTIIRNIKTEGSRVYLVRQSDFKSLKLKHFEKFGYWLLEDNQLPVLHFGRSVFKANSIQRGRLYFQPQFVDETGWVNKSDDFIKWADNMVKTVRRKLKKHKFGVMDKK